MLLISDTHGSRICKAEMALSTQRHLDQLPAELLRDICDILDFRSLKSISSVNTRLRDVSAPRLYKRLCIPASAPGLDFLKNLVTSGFAVYVKTVTLKIYPRLKNSMESKQALCMCLLLMVIVCPKGEHSDIFEKAFHSSRRSRSSDRLLIDRVFTYEEVKEHMCTLYRDQTGLLKNIPTLIYTLQQLSVLERLALHWSYDDDERFSEIYKSCRKNNDECFRKVLFAISTAMMLRGKQKKNPITSFEVFASKIKFRCTIHPRPLKEAFTTITELVIRGRQQFFDLLADNEIYFPSITRLELIVIDDIPLEQLEKFFNKTVRTLSVVHVECSYLSLGPYRCGGYDWKGQRPQGKVLDFLHTLGQHVSLKEVSLKVKDYLTVYTDFFAELLLARASPSDFELFLQQH